MSWDTASWNWSFYKQLQAFYLYYYYLFVCAVSVIGHLAVGTAH
jgi:hypothetical protein